MNNTSIIYHWSEGSLPPPNHYEYSIHVSGKDCRISFYPDYLVHNPPLWTKSFSINDESAAKLNDLINRVSGKIWIENREQPVGDFTQSIDFSVGDNSFHIPSNVKSNADLEELYSYVKNLVPRQIWDSFLSNYELFKSNYKNNQ